jgi:phospholipid transport system transporter-binding protein
LSQAQLENLGGGRLRLSGELSFRTVPALLHQSRDSFEGASRFHLDLSGVTRTDSAGLALLLEWLQACRRRQQDLLLQDLPESLAAIARISNLDRLLERMRA